MVNTLDPRYVIPLRSFLSNKAAPQLYHETKKVGEALINVTRVAFTCDSWTSRATQSFVTFTAHFITNDWQVKLCVLQTRMMMSESHTAVNLNAMLHSSRGMGA